MNAFPTDAHLHITVEPRLTRHLSQTIQTVELLELNAEGLYEYLAQAEEANPMMLVQRTPLPELPLHARCVKRRRASRRTLSNRSTKTVFSGRTALRQRANLA